ncbi:hypothetical protein, partial [Rhizobium johnstonii]|uniref:hypothetical protein n=1 Tax=Rhizobium johnstonii TaxID=3019933 RepID=UPI003F95A22B
DRIGGRACRLMSHRFGIDHPRGPPLGCCVGLFAVGLGILAAGLRLLLVLILTLWGAVAMVLVPEGLAYTQMPYQFAKDILSNEKAGETHHQH